MRRLIGLGLVGIPHLVWASTSGDPTGLSQAMGPIVFAITAFFMLVAGLVVVWLGVSAIIKFCSGREHLQDGLLNMAGAVIAGAFMWFVIPTMQRGIQAQAATPEQMNPPAIVLEIDE